MHDAAAEVRRIARRGGERARENARPEGGVQGRARHDGEGGAVRVRVPLRCTVAERTGGAVGAGICETARVGRLRGGGGGGRHGGGAHSAHRHGQDPDAVQPGRRRDATGQGVRGDGEGSREARRRAGAVAGYGAESREDSLGHCRSRSRQRAGRGAGIGGTGA